MAKWLYQMTPHDEWDFDGVNEMILFEGEVDGAGAQAAVPPGPQRHRLHARPRDRRAPGGREVRSGGELDDRRRHGPELGDLRPSGGGGGVLDRAERRGHEHHRHLPGGARHQGPAARGLLAEDRPHVRADQPRLHGLRAVPGQLHRRPALCRRDALDVPGAGQPRRHGQLHRLGSDRGRDQVVAAGAVLGLVGRAGDRGRRRLLRHARGLPEGGRLARPARSSTSSRPRRASSATSSPTSARASSTSASCRASAAGPASASRRA